MNNDVGQNKEVFSDFQKALNRQDWSLRTLGKYLKPDIVDHTAAPGERPGIEGVHARITAWHAAFAEAIEIDLAVVGEQNVLSVLYETRARHAGTFMGIPGSNRSVTIPGIKFVRFEDGLIAEIWGIYDYFTTALEIGAMLGLAPRQSGSSVPEASRRAGRKPFLVPKEGDRAALGTGPVAANKELLLRFREQVFNANDWSTENLGKFLRADIIDHNAFPGDLPGLEGVRSRFSMWQAAFDDEEEVYLAIAGENDLLAVLYELQATHSGDYLGVKATGRRVAIPGIEFLRFEGGMIAEHWGIYDFQATASEVGAELTFMPRTTELPPKPAHPHARFVPPTEIRQ
jgi:predicted ester cyclase